MPKSITRTYSRYGRNAIELLGYSIREARIEKKLTVQQVASRVGISRGLMQRIEKGDPKCEVGVVFEAAHIVGIALFEEDASKLGERLQQTKRNLSLLPKSAPKNTRSIRDDF